MFFQFQFLLEFSPRTVKYLYTRINDQRARRAWLVAPWAPCEFDLGEPGPPGCTRTPKTSYFDDK